jgi:voltage-gated potassium channel
MKLQPIPHTEREIRLRFFLCMLFLVAIIVSGTFGYRMIEGWSWLDCLYMTALTISTVGFNEVHDLTTGGTIFTIILIFFGVGTVAFAISSLLEMVFQRQLRILTERHSMNKALSKIKDHTIICGYGRIGRFIVDDLQAGHRIAVVVENDADRLSECTPRNTLFPVQGNALEEETLEEAGITRAGALVACLGTDADNLLLTLTARGMNPSLQIIVRAENQRMSRKFRQAGADQVVSPHVTGARHIAHLLLQPEVVDFVEMFSHGDQEFQLGIKTIEISEDSPFVNQTLADSHLRQQTGCMILAIKRAGGPTVFSPESNTKVMAGDTLIAVGLKTDCPTA